MCRLQVITKNDRYIISDKNTDFSALKKISVYNIPYYLTIEILKGKLRYEFKYLDSDDCLVISLEKCKLTIGKKTGRLYSIEAQEDKYRIDNKTLSSILKASEQYISDILLSELKLFFKIIQEYKTDENNYHF